MEACPQAAAHPLRGGMSKVNRLKAYLTAQSADPGCMTKRISVQEGKKHGSPDLKGVPRMAVHDPPAQG